MVTSMEVGSDLVTETLRDDKADISLIVCVREEPFIRSQSFPYAVELTEARDFE